MNITFKGVDLKVDFNYIPEEPMVMYYPDGSGHPGSAEEYEINEIIFQGVDVYEIYESLDLLSEIEEEIDRNYDPIR